MRLSFLLIHILLTVLLPSLASAAQVIGHQLTVRLNPAGGSLSVTDVITLPTGTGGRSPLHMTLHAGLQPRARTPGVTLRPVGRRRSGVDLEIYQLEIPAGQNRIRLEYGGTIVHGLSTRREGFGRGRQRSPGLISREGVFLAGSTFWYPVFGDEYIHFSLRVELPDGWQSVSQGHRGDTGEWIETTPQEEIYLIAGPFNRHADENGRAEVYLLHDDRDLARRYLKATERYLDLYSRLIGPYPYDKFALVENFWETGYGMPSFTLLGPTVIRLPFIIHTSYPHEVLHNWWGNGVYVDYPGGNWSEGLTTYLSDHLLREMRGEDARYRRDTLLDYRNHVDEGEDFPLTEFRGRHSDASQAVGYGKTMMLFHMLRRQMGDAAFIDALRLFYQDNLHKRASFTDLQKAFACTGGEDFETLFEQWVQWTGAPELRLSQARATPIAGGFRLDATLEQVQDGPVYRLQVPIAVHMQGQDEAREQVIEMKQRKLVLSLELPARPFRIQVDPRFDLFRRLHKGEVPATFSRLLGSERVLLVLPGEAPEALKQGYQALAGAWRETGVEIIWDRELERLPEDRAVWILGWQNRFVPPLLSAMQDAPLKISGDGVWIGDTRLSRTEHSFALTVTLPKRPSAAIALLLTSQAEALPGLARKLPHYGRYGYTVFSGRRPSIVLKGDWPVTTSPLDQVVVQTDGQTVPQRKLPLPVRPPLSSMATAP